MLHVSLLLSVVLLGADASGCADGDIERTEAPGHDLDAMVAQLIETREREIARLEAIPRELRRTKPRDLKQQLQATQVRLKKVRSGEIIIWPTIGEDVAIKVGQMGRLRANILQVLGPDSLLARVFPGDREQIIQVRHVDTRDLADGHALRPNDISFVAVGTDTYTTPLGTSKTVIALEPVDEATLIEEYVRAVKAKSPKPKSRKRP